MEMWNDVLPLCLPGKQSPILDQSPTQVPYCKLVYYLKCWTKSVIIEPHLVFEISHWQHGEQSSTRVYKYLSTVMKVTDPGSRW